MKTAKKLLALTLTLLLAASICTLSVSAAADYTFDFDDAEAGITGWSSAGGDATAFAHTQDKHMGATGGSLKITKAGYPLYGDGIALDMNETYVVSAYIFIPQDATVESATEGSTAKGARFGIRNYKNSGDASVPTDDRKVTQTAQLTACNGAWTRYSFTLETGNYSKFYLYINANDVSELYVDGITVEENASRELLSNGDFELMDVAGDGSVSANSWTIVEDLFEYDTTETKSGTYALKVMKGGAGAGKRAYQEITGLTGGAWYEASFWVKRNISQAGAIQILSSENVSASGLPQYAIAKGVDEEWVKHNFIFQLPEEQNKAFFSIVGHKSFADNECFYIDDINLRQLKTRAEIIDTSGNAASSITQAGTYNASFTLLSNDTSASLSKTSIVARYKKVGGVKQLDAVTVDSISVAQNAEVPYSTLSLPIEVPAGDEYEVKAFMLDLPTMQNACKAASAVTSGYNN